MFKAVALAFLFLLSQGRDAAAQADDWWPTQRELIELWTKLKAGTVDVSAELYRLSARWNEGKTLRPCPVEWPSPAVFRQLLQFVLTSDVPFDQVESRFNAIAVARKYAADELCRTLDWVRDTGASGDTLWLTALAALGKGDDAGADRALAEVPQLLPGRRLHIYALQLRGLIAMIHRDHPTAVAHYEAALKLIPGSWSDDRHWTMRKLTYTLLDQGRARKDRSALLKTIEVARAWPDRQAREERVMLKRLGDAFAALSRLETEEQPAVAWIDAAIAAYRQRLEIAPGRYDHPDGAQSDLGFALWRRAELGHDPHLLQEAVAWCRKAVETAVQAGRPTTALRNTLAGALVAQGKEEGSAVLLGEALEGYRSLLPHWARKPSPLYWASTQQAIGNTLVGLGEIGSATAPLEQAVAAYRLALEEWTRERMPPRWATLQHDLGRALMLLGERLGRGEASVARLEAAAAAFRLSLQEDTRAQADLARVLALLADLRR